MKRETGFTLIELLVVIAVIALLLAIVTPALRKAKRFAQLTICRSNQHQLGLGVIAYTVDWNSKLPPPVARGGRPCVLNRRQSNTAVYPSLGSYLSLAEIFNCPASSFSATSMVNTPGGDFSYHKHIFEASHFQKLFWNFVLATHLKAGVLDGRDRDSPGIYGEKFAPGGTDPDGMIRGYSDGSIGAIDPSELIEEKGRSVLVYNVELQYPLVEQQMYLLLFADAGNAWRSGRSMKPFALEHKSDQDLFRSLGLGVRLMIPGMGLIGFDFGYGFDHPYKGEWKPHFQFGTTF